MHLHHRSSRRSRYPLRAYSGKSASRALVMGHSFVAHLGTFLDEDLSFKITSNFDFNPTDLEVRLLGEGGRTYVSLRQLYLPQLNQAQPHIVHLEIGTNELGRPSTEPLALAHSVTDLVRELHFRYGVFFITVGQVTKRFPTTRNPSPPDDFNERAHRYNGYLRDCLELLSYANYWSHRRLWRAATPLHRRDDGIHFNSLGKFQLYKSIKGALLYAQRRNPMHQRHGACAALAGQYQYGGRQ